MRLDKGRGRALLQGCLFFAFLVALAVGKGAGNHIENDDRNIAESVDGIRAIQSRVAQVMAMLPALPSPHNLLVRDAGPLLDELNYIGGCQGADARSAEANIIHLLDVFQTQCQTKAILSECRETLVALQAAIAARKACRNA